MKDLNKLRELLGERKSNLYTVCVIDAFFKFGVKDLSTQIFCATCNESSRVQKCKSPKVQKGKKG